MSTVIDFPLTINEAVLTTKLLVVAACVGVDADPDPYADEDEEGDEVVEEEVEDVEEDGLVLAVLPQLANSRMMHRPGTTRTKRLSAIMTETSTFDKTACLNDVQTACCMTLNTQNSYNCADLQNGANDDEWHADYFRLYIRR